MENNFYNYKGVKAYKGKNCPPWLRSLYRAAVFYECQQCFKHENEVGKLEPHRIIRGTHGGMYTVCKLNNPSNNVKIVCNICHKKFHEKEKMGRK